MRLGIYLFKLFIIYINTLPFKKKTGETSNQNMFWNRVDESAIEIGFHTEKSPSELMKLVVAYTPLKSTHSFRCANFK